MNEQEMKAFADALWDYFFPKIKEYLSDGVFYYQATVTAAPSNGQIIVRRPFDEVVTLPYANNASTLQVGDSCTVLVFGDFNNQLVIGNLANL